MRNGLTVLLVMMLQAPLVAQTTSERPVPPELAGKWCYYNLSNGDQGSMSNSCLTLNDDGSYELFIDGATMARVRSLAPSVGPQETDYGTWWVKDSMIYFDSKTHGQVHVTMQKMNQPTDKTVPMILLGGISFVTASGKDAW